MSWSPTDDAGVAPLPPAWLAADPGALVRLALDTDPHGADPPDPKPDSPAALGIVLVEADSRTAVAGVLPNPPPRPNAGSTGALHTLVDGLVERLDRALGGLVPAPWAALVRVREGRRRTQVNDRRWGLLFLQESYSAGLTPLGVLVHTPDGTFAVDGEHHPLPALRLVGRRGDTTPRLRRAGPILRADAGLTCTCHRRNPAVGDSTAGWDVW